MAKYSDDFKAGVLAMLQGAGYPENEYAIGEVYRHMKTQGSSVSKDSIRRWAEGKHVNATVDGKVATHKKDMGTALESLFWKLYEHALGDETIDQLKGAQAYTAMGIVLDKYRLVQGLPTEIVQVIMPAVQALERAGKNPVEVFKEIERQANEIADNGSSEYTQ